MTCEDAYDVCRYADFNSHAHVERDPPDIHDVAKEVDFNSHAHVERDNDVISKRLKSINFNSHAHVERDICVVIFIKTIFSISTHTLTWSVTWAKP